AAVVGVILNLSVWFALHVLFAQIEAGGTLPVPRPDWATLDPWAVLLTLVAMGLMLGLRLGLLSSLAILAACGTALGALGAL
ncbi:MAG: chromate transporter, partial [Planctomycetota bacterium]